MRKAKLTKQEKEIENTLIAGEYLDVSPSEFKSIAQAIEARKKDAVLNVRINSKDLDRIKKIAKKLGVRYQSFISEILHRVAQG